MNHNPITKEDVLKVLDYFPQEGIFKWKARNLGTNPRTEAGWNTKYAGKEAGTIDSSGYWQVRINKKLHFVHRLVWLMEYGRLPITILDHINRNKTDNRISNLREVTHSENSRNQNLQINNTSGVIGVCRGNGAWVAQLKVRGSRVLFSTHKTIEAATEARRVAELKYL